MPKQPQESIPAITEAWEGYAFTSSLFETFICSLVSNFLICFRFFEVYEGGRGRGKRALVFLEVLVAYYSRGFLKFIYFDSTSDFLFSSTIFWILFYLFTSQWFLDSYSSKKQNINWPVFFCLCLGKQCRGFFFVMNVNNVRR